MCYIVMESKQRVNLSLGTLYSNLTADEEHYFMHSVGIDLDVYNCDMNWTACL